MPTQLTIADLFTDPNHYLFALEGDAAIFRAMDRAAYHRSIFLDRRIDAVGTGTMKVPLGALLGHPLPPPPRIGWIFHIAHCGSTLLARGLDRMEESLVLREPVPLRQIAVECAQAFAGGPASDGWRRGLSLIHAMLGRRYRADAPVIVKANVPVNFILPEIAAMDADAPAIFLYFTLDDYLAAILRSPNHRAWVMGVTRELQPAIAAWVGSLDGLGEAECAAALWLAQMRAFTDAMVRMPGAVSLDAEAMFAAPTAAIAAAAAHFGMGEGEVPDALTGTYAKNPDAAFTNADRLARRDAVRAEIAGELAGARRWVEGRMGDYPVPQRLPRPLVGDNALLLR